MYSNIVKKIIRKQVYLYKISLFIWTYYKTKQSKKNFRRLLKENESINLVVGASGVFDSNWIPSDINYLNILNKSDWQSYFELESIDGILSEHVWEHLTIEEGEEAARNCYSYLKTNAYIRVAVPDGYHPDKDYIDNVKIGGSGAGADDHKVLYTYKSLSTVFEKAGFKVEYLEYYDEYGVFHKKYWDRNKGMIHRSADNDKRNKQDKYQYTSIIIDAKKL